MAMAYQFRRLRGNSYDISMLYFPSLIYFANWFILRFEPKRKSIRYWSMGEQMQADDNDATGSVIRSYIV